MLISFSLFAWLQKLLGTLPRALRFDVLKVFTDTNGSLRLIVLKYSVFILYKKEKFGIAEAWSLYGVNLIKHCEEIFHLMLLGWRNCSCQ